MPTVYRAMFADGELPKIGPSKSMLGAKIGHDEYDDIGPDEDGSVVPGTGGMSVAPSWRMLPSHRIPRRLNSKLEVPRAIGNNRSACWRYGSGDFETSGLTDELKLVVENPRHGVVEPLLRMHTDQYQRALAATAPDWAIDED